MSPYLKSILEFFSSFHRPHPARDWLIVVFFAIVALLFGVGLAAYLFLEVQTGSLVSASAEVPRAPIPVTKDAIKTVVETYQVRATNFVNKSFPGVNLSDPRRPGSKK